MTAVLIGGPYSWEGDRDEEGYREYKISHRVMSSYTDGPFAIMNCAGLPLPGAIWAFGDDVDVWAFCTWKMAVKYSGQKEGEPFKFWMVDQTFTTKPLARGRCQDASIEDPLLEPPKLSGSFTKYTEERTRDRFGNPFKNSAHEPLRGPQVEFDSNRPTVKIEQNVSTLGLSLFSPMIDCLNDSVLWGLPTRCVKLSNVAWERKIFGLCNFYFTRALDFDIRYDGFDRRTPDYGTMVLSGHWGIISAGEADGWVLDNINGTEPNPNNPQHFIRYKDRTGEPARVLLDGGGLPANSAVLSGTSSETSGGYTEIELEGYDEVNFLLLGIPTELE